MSEIIERVALAISGGNDAYDVLAIHRSRARLAIEAMRKPTDAMCIVYEHDWDAVTPEDVWKAMIDVATKP